MSFDGDPVKYWTFIRVFENVVDKETIGDGAKLAWLLQYCTGPARKLIQCCAVKETSEGYHLARKLLQSLFGNAYDISDAWISKIVGYPAVTNNKGLLEFSDELRICCETLLTMDKLGELNNRQSLPKIIEKLPFDLRSWLNKVHHLKFIEMRLPAIDAVLVSVSVAAECANDPVFGKLLSEDRFDKLHRNTNPRENWKSRPHLRRLLHIIATQKPCPDVHVIFAVCPYCGQRHYLFD